MNVYSVPLGEDTLEALQLLKAGVSAISITKDLPTDEWPRMCHFETVDGRLVQIEAASEDLEFMFEVFPLVASVKSRVRATERKPLGLTPPVVVTPLQTESWLDPGAPTGETVGSNAVAQFVGTPGSVAASASATCRYVGAVELKGSNGLSIIVATGTFPFSMHVPGFYEDRFFRREDYVAYLHEA